MTRRSLCALALAIASLGTPGAFAAQAVVRAASNPDLDARLADQLRDLDQDQSRKLTRQIEPAQSRYSRIDFAAVVDLIEAREGSAVAILGRRGPLPDSPLEVQRILTLPEPAGAKVAAPRVRGRDGYVPKNGLDLSWASLLRNATGDAPETPSDARGLIDALAKSKDAAFIFLLGPGKAGAAQKLVVVPDTVMVTVTGDKVPDVSRGHGPRMSPSPAMTMPTPPPEPPHWEPPPPPMPVPVPPPDEEDQQ